jgi:hypothetical protein
LSDGTGGLLSWAEAGVMEQARLTDAAAVSRVRIVGDFMGYRGGAVVRTGAIFRNRGRARVPARREQVCAVNLAERLDLVRPGLR